MAIQMRRGAKSNFDPSKMLPGEWAVVLSGDDTPSGYAVYMCYAAGTVKRLVTEDELASLPQNVYNEVMATLSPIVSNAQHAASAANEAASSANAAASSAGEATQEAEQATADALAAIEAMGDISELAVPEMSANIRGGAKLGVGLDVSDGRLNIDLSDSGSGSSVLTNGCALLDVEGDGWAEQDTTTGKNLLLNYNAVGSTTVNGITYTTNADGSVTINGTATAESRLYIVRRQDQESAELASIINGGGQLTLSTSTPTLTGVRLEIAYWLGSAYAGRVTNVINGATSTTFSAPDVSFDQITAYFMIANGITVSNITFYPQLEAGSTATSYESYTGGKPSPSPDYPQEVRVAKGRNLYQIVAPQETRTADGLTWVYDSNGIYLVTGTATGQSWMIGNISDNQIYLEAGTYTVSVPDGFNPYVRTRETPTGTTTTIVSTTTSTFATFTLESAKYVQLTARAIANRTYANTIAYIQLEAGSTATPYVPYGYVGLEIKGKNLLPDDAQSTTSNGITYTRNADGSVTVNGTATAASSFVFKDFLRSEFDGNTYFLSGCPSGGSSSTYYMRALKPSPWTSYATDTGNGATLNLANIAADTVVRVQIGIASGTTVNNLTFYPQLEAGSIATPYVKYIDTTIPVPIPSDGLAALPDGTHDTLAIDSAGHVVIEKRVGIVDLGDFNWTYQSANSRFVSSSGITDAKPVGSSSTVSNLLCDYFQATTPDGTSGAYKGERVALGASDTLIRIQTNLWTDAAAFKTAISGVSLYYELATPTTIDLGYIDLPLMPDGCMVSIPELHEIGVEWVVTRAEAIPEMVADVRKWALHEIELASDAGLSTIAAVENATASTNYAVGSYLVHGGTLYRVTTAIATGETITPGSNVTATTVMAELIRLTA